MKKRAKCRYQYKFWKYKTVILKLDINIDKPLYSSTLFMPDTWTLHKNPSNQIQIQTESKTKQMAFVIFQTIFLLVNLRNK